MNSEQLEAERKAFESTMKSYGPFELDSNGNYASKSTKHAFNGWQASRSQPAETKDENICQNCGGYLDTGFECNDCGKLQKPTAPRVVSDEGVSKPSAMSEMFDRWYETRFKPAMERSSFDKYVARQAWFAALESIAPEKPSLSIQAPAWPGWPGPAPEGWVKMTTPNDALFELAMREADKQPAPSVCTRCAGLGVHPNDDAVFERDVVCTKCAGTKIQPAQPSVPVEELRALIQAAIDQHAYWGEVGVIAQVDLEQLIAAHDGSK